MWNIIGHQKIIELLQRQISKKSLSHSYLFVGEKNLGKRKTAFEFSRTIFCEKRLPSSQKAKPCLQCQSCLKLLNNAHPDFLEIKKEPDKKNISINQIRNLKSFFSLKPFYSQYKIAIIDEANLLTIEAQNSFLKILEERPLNRIIILLTEKKNDLLSTIVSRCQIIQFFSVKNQEIKKEIQARFPNLSSFRLKEILEQAYTRPGIALKFLEKPEILEKNKNLINKFLEILQKPVFQKFEYVEKKAKEEKEKILEEIDLWLLFLNKELIRENSSLSSQKKLLNFSLEKKVELIEKILKLKKNLKEESNLKLALENFFI